MPQEVRREIKKRYRRVILIFFSLLGNNVLNDQQMRILYAFDDAAYLMENGFSVPKELEGLLRNTIRFVLTE